MLSRQLNKCLHFTNLVRNFDKKLDKWVPHKFFLAFKANEPFVNRTVTCYEKWVNYDNSRCLDNWLKLVALYFS